MNVFTLQAFHEDTKIVEGTCKGSLKRALRQAYAVADGVPCCWVGVRYRGQRIAEVQTNWRGEVTEVSVCPPKTCRVTAIYPAYLA
jgi:hypothetical protein